MLKEIENILKERGPTSTRDIALHLESTPDAIDGMLKLLERKGHIEKVSTSCRRSCSGCACPGGVDDLSACVWSISANL